MLSLTLPRYARDLGATSQAVGLLAGIYALCAFCIRPFSGQLVDNENKIVLLRIILVLILISVFGLTLSKKYWFLVAFRGLNGFAWGVGSTLCMTIATESFPERNMAGGIGIYGLGQTIAQTVAPVFALPVANHLGYNNLYYVNVILIIICLLLTGFFKITPVPKHSRHYSLDLKKMIHVPAILPASLTLCGTIGKSSVMAFLVIFGETLNIGNIGLYFTVQAATVFISRPFISRMADKHGILKILIPCEALAVVGLIIIALSHSLPVFLIAAIFMGVSAAGEQPILMAECVRSADASRTGRASNTSYVGLDVGQFVGSNLAGILVAYLGYRKMYALATSPIILCTIVFVVLYKRRQHSANGQHNTMEV
jgi:MFS family permease